MEPPRQLLNRNFLLLWQGQTISRVGDQLFEVALLFFVKHLTDSASLVGLMMMVSALPAVLLGPIGGTFADRHARRKILIVTDTINGLVVIALAALVFCVPEAVNLALVMVFIAAVVIATAAAFFNPAISASVPDLVPQERVASANSLNQMSMQLALFIGQSLGGVLFRVLGAPILFLVNGLSYLFAAASESFVRIPQLIPEKSPHWREQFRDFKRDTLVGFRYVWERSGLRTLVLVSAFLNFFSVPVIVLLPFFVEDTLGATADWYGFIIAATGVGALIGYIFAGALRMSNRTRGRVLLAFIVVESFGYGLLGFVSTPSTAVVLGLLDGFVSGVVMVNITTLLQVTTPSEMRGRVFGLLGTISGSLTPIAMGLAGVIADLLNRNIPAIYVACGVIMVLLSGLAALNRNFRQFLTSAPSADGTERAQPITTPVASQ
jgi:MFS transporter, DHA3 family, macrolide efflux protein